MKKAYLIKYENDYAENVQYKYREREKERERLKAKTQKQIRKTFW